VIVLAHRGLRTRGPENSLAGFQGVADAAAKGIPLGIEFDVRRTADDVLVTAHDDNIVVASGSGHMVVADVWYESMQRVLVEYCPPTLSDALKIVAKDVPLIDLDIKERGYTQAVVDACADVDPTKLSFSSHIPEVIVEARKFAPFGARIGMSVDEYWHFGNDALIDLLYRVDADFLFLNHTLVSQEIIDRLHALGKEVGSYTLNDKQQLQKFIELGVDFPCTDKPEMAIKELQEK
jgi:glycerophosphoryl diester phosphodiesterase